MALNSTIYVSGLELERFHREYKAQRRHFEYVAASTGIGDYMIKVSCLFTNWVIDVIREDA